MVVSVYEKALIHCPCRGVVVPPEQAVVVQLAKFLANIETIGVRSNPAVVRHVTPIQGDPTTRVLPCNHTD